MNLISNQRGDTIVEVLVAIAVVALVLGGALATTRDAQLNTQRNQERAFASRLLETELESIQHLSYDAENPIYTVPIGTPFCIIEEMDFDVNISAICTTSPIDSGASYDISATRMANNTFHVLVEWDRLGGENVGNRDSVEAYYKVHPGL